MGSAQAMELISQGDEQRTHTSRTVILITQENRVFFLGCFKSPESHIV